MNYKDIKTFEERRKENLGRPRHHLDREEIEELRAYIVGYKNDSNHMKYKDIKYFSERCETHPDHQDGMISEQMLKHRLHEEIDELRTYIEFKLKES